MPRPPLFSLVRILSITACVSLVAPATHAGPGRDRLEAFFREVGTVEADFVQTLLDPDGTVVQESRGTMVIQRPNRFRWDYEQPYEQVIVGDGEKLWLYDVDLEQITVKPMETALGNSPAVLLSGAQPLEQNFSMVDQGLRGGQYWVELRPRQKDATFERMLLGFNEHDLQSMELFDSFGQTTRLRFSNVQRDPQLDKGIFVFVPPPGVDVIGEPE